MNHYSPKDIRNVQYVRCNRLTNKMTNKLKKKSITVQVCLFFYFFSIKNEKKKRKIWELSFLKSISGELSTINDKMKLKSSIFRHMSACTAYAFRDIVQSQTSKIVLETFGER